jgi:N-acetylglucosaminyl-diphospho-decaprenol L-rhamnosyltransferase
MELSVIIVTWNSGRVIDKCLSALENAIGGLSFSVHVTIVDNKSSDNTIDVIREFHPNVEIIQNIKNCGFAAGVNCGIRVCNGDYIMLVNPDTIVSQEVIIGLTQWLESNHRIAGAAPRLVFSDGRLQFAGDKFWGVRSIALRQIGIPRGFALIRSVFSENCASHRRTVDWLSGACLLLRRTALQDVGLLDEEYFLYWEDQDWCYRATARGWKLWSLGDLAVVHLHSESSDVEHEGATIANIRATYTYFRKRGRPVGAVLAVAILYCGLLLRFTIWKIIALACQSKAAQSRVLSYKRALTQIIFGGASGND